MTNDTNPELHDILKLLKDIPEHPEMIKTSDQLLDHLFLWLSHYSKIYDLSRGFNVNRCALYWSGYDAIDDFDGKAFVDSCQSTNSPLKSLVEILDSDLQIFELDPQNHAKVDARTLALAASYGMMAIDESTQLFAACSFGQGVHLTAEEALTKLNQTDGEIDLQEFMIDHCGLDHAALIGAVIAASLKGIPVILEGASARLIRAMLQKSTGKVWGNIIIADDFNDLLAQQNTNQNIGQSVMQIAIFLKTLWISADKSPCGKIVEKAA